MALRGMAHNHNAQTLVFEVCTMGGRSGMPRGKRLGVVGFVSSLVGSWRVVNRILGVRPL